MKGPTSSTGLQAMSCLGREYRKIVIYLRTWSYVMFPVHPGSWLSYCRQRDARFYALSQLEQRLCNEPVQKEFFSYTGDWRVQPYASPSGNPAMLVTLRDVGLLWASTHSLPNAANDLPEWDMVPRRPFLAR